MLFVLLTLSLNSQRPPLMNLPNTQRQHDLNREKHGCHLITNRKPRRLRGIIHKQRHPRLESKRNSFHNPNNHYAMLSAFRADLVDPGEDQRTGAIHTLDEPVEDIVRFNVFVQREMDEDCGKNDLLRVQQCVRGGE